MVDSIIKRPSMTLTCNELFSQSRHIMRFFNEQKEYAAFIKNYIKNINTTELIIESKEKYYPENTLELFAQIKVKEKNTILDSFYLLSVTNFKQLSLNEIKTHVSNEILKICNLC